MFFRVLLLAIFLNVTPVAHGQDSLIVKSVYFGGGSYYIDWSQVGEIEEFINEIEQLENFEIIIFSHTDNIGGKEYNEWLSRKRSEAVYRQLLNNNVPNEFIQIRDFGLANPLYTNTSNAGRHMNRRVDIILWPLVF